MSEVTSTASSIRFTITGIEQLVSNFAILPRGIAYKYVQSGMRKHMQQYVPQLKVRTTKGPTGNLRRSVQAKGEYKPPYRVLGIVGYSKINGKNGSHAHLVESGTKFRAPKTKGTLAIPSEFVKKYRYLRKTGVLAPSNDSYWYRAVRGMPKAGHFKAWQKSKKKDFVLNLETILLDGFNKACAEVARRPG